MGVRPKKLTVWAEWHFSRVRAECTVCLLAQRDGLQKKVQCDGIETVDACPLGDVPKLSARNSLFWRFYIRCAPGLYNGMGGFDYGAVVHCLALYAVPHGLREPLMEKVLAVIGALRAVQAREEEK